MLFSQLKTPRLKTWEFLIELLIRSSLPTTKSGMVLVEIKLSPCSSF
jgi:hypothetical protein